MVRTQIQLTENQALKIRRAASARNVSFAEVVRQCIDQSLDQSDVKNRYARARRIIGRVRERRGKANTASHHDRCLEDAFS
jgi:hypothetical protein